MQVGGKHGEEGDIYLILILLFLICYFAYNQGNFNLIQILMPNTNVNILKLLNEY